METSRISRALVTITIINYKFMIVFSLIILFYMVFYCIYLLIVKYLFRFIFFISHVFCKKEMIFIVHRKKVITRAA